MGGNGTLTVSWSTPYAAAAYSLGQLSYSVTVYPVDRSPSVGPFNTTGLTLTVGGLPNGKAHSAVVTAYYPSLCVCGTGTPYGLVGSSPPDMLMGAGSRGFFSYDKYNVSDKTTVKVNVGSGNLVVAQGDFALPGAAGSYNVGQDYNLALSPSASTNSNGGGTGTLIGRRIPDLSPGWRFDTGSDVTLATGAGVVTYYDRSGAAWTFTQAGQGWNPPPGLNVAMAHNRTSGQWTVVDHETNQTLAVERRRYSLTRYDYSTPGRTVVTDPDGHLPIVYTIDSSYRVTDTVDGAGATTNTVWTGNSAVGAATNQTGGTTTNTYGANAGPNGNESPTRSVNPTNTVNLGSYGNGTGYQANNPAAANYLPATTTAPLSGPPNTATTGGSRRSWDSSTESRRADPVWDAEERIGAVPRP